MDYPIIPHEIIFQQLNVEKGDIKLETTFEDLEAILYIPLPEIKFGN